MSRRFAVLHPSKTKSLVIPNDAFFIAAEESQSQPPPRTSVEILRFSPPLLSAECRPFDTASPARLASKLEQATSSYSFRFPELSQPI
jgi:hypothetical protein